HLEPIAELAHDLPEPEPPERGLGADQFEVAHPRRVLYVGPVKRPTLSAALALAAWLAPAAAVAEPLPRLRPGAEAWAESGLGGVRGITIGPIESLRHPDKGYGTEASARSIDEAARMGATWVSFTVFGRTWD